MSSTLPTHTSWTLNQAAELIRLVVTAVAPHYHVALGGSVLMNGWSWSDLDLILYPDSTLHQDLVQLRKRLETVGLVLRHDRATVTLKWRRKGSMDAKHVEVWDFQGKKVDLFFLS